MGIADRKEREKQEMKRLIMDTAMRMFLEEGYEKTSIRNIAERIEYSPATIYLYYKDKDELLYDVQARAFEQLLLVFQTQAASKDPLKRLEEITKSYVRFGLENQDLYDLMFIIRAPMNKVEKDEQWLNGEACFAYLVTCLDECIEKELIRFTDKLVAALSIWSMVHGLVALNVRCRFKVMHMEEEGLHSAINKTIDDYLNMIRS
jgi:AcrR family transcriptional regulator